MEIYLGRSWLPRTRPEPGCTGGTAARICSAIGICGLNAPTPDRELATRPDVSAVTAFVAPRKRQVVRSADRYPRGVR
ncbi:MAG TPA: hypothetical protein VFG55_08145, partial [Rhodanobacteraceae bacterium]|nr:hypothetical protein [Rhodanobacteraceae bacterium]